MIDNRSYILDRMKSKAVSIEEFNFDSLTAPPLYSMFSPQDIYELNKIAKSLKYAAKPQVKYQEIDKIMRRRGFVKFIAGTNRVVYRPLENDTFLVKVAADAVGLGDNPREFMNQQIFKPFVTKVFEVSPCGTIGVFERVVPITSREEYLSVAEDIFVMINEWFIGEYVLEDIGTRFFMNMGIRKGFGPVLLDFPYVYKLDGDKLFCNAPNPNNPSGCCEGVIDYDDGYNFLYCTKCGVKYKAKELAEAVKQNNVIVKSEGDIHMKFTCKGGTLGKNETVETGMYAGMAKATPVKPVKKESKTTGMKLKDSCKKENVEEVVGEDEPSPSSVIENFMYKESKVPTVDNKTPMVNGVPLPYVEDEEGNKKPVENIINSTSIIDRIDQPKDESWEEAKSGQDLEDWSNEITGIPEWAKDATSASEVDINSPECVDGESNNSAIDTFVLKEKETDFGYSESEEPMMDKTVNGVNATPAKVSPIEFIEESSTGSAGEVNRAREFIDFVKNHFDEIDKDSESMKEFAKELLKFDFFMEFVKEYLMKKELENNKSTAYREGYSFGLAECGGEIDKLRNEAFALKQEIEDSTKEKERYIAACKEKENKLDMAKETIDRLEKAIEEKDQHIAKVLEEAAGVKEELDRKEANHKDIVTGLESTIEELAKRDTEGVETISKKDEEIEKLKVQLNDANNIISSKDMRITVLTDELLNAKNEIEQVTCNDNVDKEVGLPEPSEEACDSAEPEVPTPKTFGEMVTELAAFIKANNTNIIQEDVLDPEFVYDLDEIVALVFGPNSPYDIDVSYEDIKWDEENECLVIQASSTVTRAYTVNGDEMDKQVCLGNGYDITVNSTEVLNILKGVSIKDASGTGIAVHTVVAEDKEDTNSMKPTPTAVVDNVGYNGLKFYSASVLNARDLDTTQNYKKCIVVLDEEENYLKDRNGFIIMIDVLDDREVAKLSVVSSDWLSKMRARNDELEKVEENYNLVVTGTRDGDAYEDGVVPEGSVATAPVEEVLTGDSSKVTVEATESVKEDVVEEPNEYGVMEE